MTDLKPITDAILEDARIRAEAIMKDAGSVAESLRNEWLHEQEQIKSDFEKKVTDEVDRIYSSKNAQLSELERSAFLNERVRAINEAAYEAVRQIGNLPDEEYVEFIKRLVKKADADKASVVFLNEKDKKRIDAGIFSPAKLADDVVRILGGFKMTGKSADYDFSLEAILEESFDKICDEVDKVYKKGVAE